jgi:7,8-dihydroneopterin aldolase/epimerase/oxygenase
MMNAHHGIYEEEEKIGANYELNLDVKFDEEDSKFEQIEDTISYEELFTIVKKKMMVPTPLLEKVCEGIIRKIRHEFAGVKEIAVSIYKLEAPIENFQGKVGVTMRKKFDD